jgi:hypothetical protein
MHSLEQQIRSRLERSMVGWDNRYCRAMAVQGPCDGVVVDDVHSGHRLVSARDVGQLGSGVTVDRSVRFDHIHVRDLRHGTLSVCGGSEQHLMTGLDEAAGQPVDDRLHPPFAGGGTGTHGAEMIPIRTKNPSHLRTVEDQAVVTTSHTSVPDKPVCRNQRCTRSKRQQATRDRHQLVGRVTAVSNKRAGSANATTGAGTSARGMTTGAGRPAHHRWL